MVNAKRYLFPCPMRSAGKNTWNDLYHGGREREREKALRGRREHARSLHLSQAEGRRAAALTGQAPPPAGGRPPWSHSRSGFTAAAGGPAVVTSLIQ